MLRVDVWASEPPSRKQTTAAQRPSDKVLDCLERAPLYSPPLEARLTIEASQAQILS